MEGKQYEIEWTKRAQDQMKNVYDFISRDSLQNAAKVIDDIVKAAEKAIANPECIILINTS